MKENKWIRLLAYVTGLVNQELLLQTEYSAAENRILRAHLPARLRLSDPERSTLAEIGKGLGRKALAQVASVAKPDIILAWYRKLIAREAQSVVASGSVAYSSITAMPHELFDQTGRCRCARLCHSAVWRFAPA